MQGGGGSGKAKTVGNAKEKYLIFMKTSSENNQTMREAERGRGGVAEERRMPRQPQRAGILRACCRTRAHTHIVAAHVCVLMFALQLVRVRV